MSEVCGFGDTRRASDNMGGDIGLPVENQFVSLSLEIFGQ